jgi:uncharacterized protein (DUF1800 family)
MTAVLAANRFGLGPRPGELAAIGSDPRGWLKAQLAPSNALPATITALSGSEARLAAPPPPPPATDKSEQTPRKLFQAVLKKAREQYAPDAIARLQAGIASQTPFVEHLVAFWSNHFSVSALRPAVTGLAGPYEAEAIRPHLFGRFADLLKAATLHPAMLIYLDNWNSIGPKSRAGTLRDKGLNENLARELMELHTLGVDGGYTQADVTELAKILTGWTIRRPRLAHDIATARGAAIFVPAVHEPGGKTLLGKSYRDQGADEADAALEDLARRPATARFIAKKLARHFIADDPPPEVVAALAETFTKTDGDLAAVSARLVDLDAAWSGAGKYRTPYEWVVAIFRAFAADDPDRAKNALQAMRQLGQRLHFAPSPAGWPDDSAYWLAPESLLARVDYAEAVGRTKGEVDPLQLAGQSLGATLTPESKQAIERAPSRSDAVALLLVSPEFLRR